jgi:hypothetical protein
VIGDYWSQDFSTGKMDGVGGLEPPNGRIKIC